MDKPQPIVYNQYRREQQEGNIDGINLYFSLTISCYKYKENFRYHVDRNLEELQNIQ